MLEKKERIFCFLIIGILFTVIGFQAVMSFTYATSYLVNQNNKKNSQQDTNLRIMDYIIFPKKMQINQFNISSQPQTWFYLNLVIIILLPIGLIIQGIFDSKRKGLNVKKDNPSNEPSETELKIAQPENKNPIYSSIIRYGFLALLIQNTIFVILMFVIVGWSIAAGVNNIGEDLPPETANAINNLGRILLIIVHIDFITAILCAIGIFLITPTIRNKIQGYICAILWLIWIPIGITPRIIFSIDSGAFGPSPGYDNYQEILLKYTGYTLFLFTLSSIMLAIALFYTSRFLSMNGLAKKSGIMSTFGLINYVIGALTALLLLVPLTYGYKMTEGGITAIIFIDLVFWFLKLMAVPIFGIAASILIFKQLKPETKTVS